MRPRPAAFAVALSICILCAAPLHAVKRRAFVTSVQGTGDLFSWAGSSGATALDRADSVCRARAVLGGLPNANTYRAWLSTSTVDAYCHVQGLAGTRANACGSAVQPGGGPWYLFNGVSEFTADLATLTGSGRVIYRPVIFDEFGSAFTDSGDSYWTATAGNGSNNGNGDCSGWTSTSGQAYGGSVLGAGPSWTYDSSGTCSHSRRLLCLEPGDSEATPIAWQPGALVFVTSVHGSGNLSSWPQAGGLTGLAAGDAICRNVATAAHLPSPTSFVAWLSDSTADAADRLTGDGPYRRLDGFAVAVSKGALTSGATSNSIHVDESFHYLTNSLWTWTGTEEFGSSTGNHCAGWTSGSVTDVATAGTATLSRDRHWTANFNAWNCDATYLALYCFSSTLTLFWDGFEYTGDTSRWSVAAP